MRQKRRNQLDLKQWLGGWRGQTQEMKMKQNQGSGHQFSLHQRAL